MLRIILDTNIYGRLAEEPDREEIEKRIIENKEFMAYNFQLIRKEIRNIPKVTKASKKVRILLLNMYDRITDDHFIKNSVKIINLAKMYYNHYRSLGGIYGWDTNIRVDFMIVACASAHNMDIVYSSDQRTMLGKITLKAYNNINTKENLRTPDFMDYIDLLKRFRNQD